MNITIKDVPEALHKRLREVADESGRSLNKLILFSLEQSMLPRKVDRGELLVRIRRRREDMSTWLDDKSLREAIQKGRR